MNARTLSGGTPMTPWIEGLAAKYGAIAFGVAAGTAAKYGLMMAEGRKLTARIFMTDVLLVGMVVLIASNAVERMGVDGQGAAMVAASIAIASDRVIAMLRTRFLRQVDAHLQADFDRAKGELRQQVQLEVSGSNVIHDAIRGDLPDIPTKPTRLP